MECRPNRTANDSTEWLRATLACIADGVIITDRLGRVAFLNPAAQALTGWTLEQALNVPLDEVFTIVNETARAGAESPALHARPDGVTLGTESRTVLIARDGSVRPIDDSAAPIRDSDGETAGQVRVFRDVTDQRTRDQLLREALEYATSIIQTIPGPFLVLTAEFRVVTANLAFYELFKVSPEDCEGRLLFELGAGQWDIPELRRLLTTIVPRTQSFDGFAVEHDSPSGVGRRRMLLNARRIRGPGDHSQHILLGIEDVTERPAAQPDLRDSEVRYRRLFQTAKDGILILDADTGKIIDANDFMSALMGIQPHELLGKELHEIGMFADVEANKAAFRELQRTGYLRHEHLPVRNHRGEEVAVEFIANVYRENDRLVAQANVRDISERVALQARIEVQAAQLADDSRRKDEFLAMLSHELRNPLAPIRSAVHLLKVSATPGDENPMHRQAREIIERQVASMTKLVGDLLEVSRVLSGRVRLEQRIVDLNQVVRHATETAMPLIERQHHTLGLHLGDHPLWVNIDPARMEEVFINLLNNAAKYTDRDGQIDVWCERSSDSRAVQVRIRDNGIGVDAKLIPRIFDLFAQAERSLDRSQGGLGIGLSVVHRLVSLHGGTIEVDSPPENQARGSEFIVRLPPATSPATTATHPADQVDAQATQRLRILMVDDNLDLVMITAIGLRHKGYVVHTSYNGTDGLAAALHWRPDVVLLDIGLPGMDGYEVARRIRGDSTASHMRLVACTGYGHSNDLALAREAGFDAHVVKPATFDELESAITSTGSWRA